MNRIVAGLLLMAVTVAGAGAEPPFFESGWRVVFPGEHARELVAQCSRVSPGPVEGTWTPTDADLDAMEPALLDLLGTELAKVDHGQYAAPEFYFRQYGGLVIGGKRVIYVNGFNKSIVEGLQRTGQPSEGWRTQAVMICDGGPIVFGVEYDPAAHTFAHFSFNGSV